MFGQLNRYNDDPFQFASAPSLSATGFASDYIQTANRQIARPVSSKVILSTTGSRNIGKTAKKGLNGLIIAAIVMLAIVLLLPVIYLIAYPPYKNKKNDNCSVTTSTPKLLAGAGMQQAQQQQQQSAPRVMSTTASNANVSRFPGTPAAGMASRVVDNVAMFPQNAGQGNYYAALAKAQATERASFPNQASTLAGAKNIVTGSVVAGGGDVERSLAATSGLAQKYADQTGLLPQVIAESSGASLTHAAKTAVRADQAMSSFSDGTLASIDPEGAAKLDKAMSSVGVPGVWGMDAVTAEERKKAELMKSMLLTGQVDPSAEDVLAASAPYVATAEMARRAIAAQGALDRTMIIRPATRFLYQNALYRPAVATPTMSPFAGDNGLTPGQENYLMSIGCGTQDAPLIQETY